MSERPPIPGCKEYTVVRVSPSWKVQKMITLGVSRRYYVEKYKRFQMRRTRFLAHYQLGVTPTVGSRVWARPTRPISARKRYTVYG